MSIEPTSSIFIFKHEYLIRDRLGQVLARFRKSVFESLFLRRWHCSDAQEVYQFSAIEDSLLKAIARRILWVGKFIPMHFNFSKKSGKSFGSFIRGFTLRDRYRLEFDAAVVPPWQMLLGALLLDTGEER